MLGTEVAQKGVLGVYLFIIFIFTCQYDQLVGVCSGRLKGGGVLGAGTARKMGVLGAGQTRKKGGLRCGSGQKKGFFTAAHIYAEHICEYPPPPPGYPYGGPYITIYALLHSLSGAIIVKKL